MTRTTRTSSRQRLVALLAWGLAVAPAVAQEAAPPTPPADPIETLGPDSDAQSPLMGRLSGQGNGVAEQRKRIRDIELQLRKIRHQHFTSVRKTEVRQAGILKLREFTDPIGYPSLYEIFKFDKPDVRLALLDHFHDQRSDAGDGTLAWIAIMDSDQEYRLEAMHRIRSREAENEGMPGAVARVIYRGLQSGDERAVNGASELAAGLDFAPAIPWLISAQALSAAAAAGESDRKGDLAWIAIGQQTAFISDLTPVVAPSAVAFDPQMSVLNTGVLLRVQDAVVTTYRIIVHENLTSLSSRLWGRSTEGLGYDTEAWQKWYTDEFVPSRLSGAK